MKKVALLTLGLLMVCNCAFAALSPFEDLKTVGFEGIEFSKSFDKTTTNFIDYYEFSIVNSDLTAGVAALNFKNVKNISSLLFNFYEDKDLLTQIKPTDVDGLTYFFSNLASSTYYFTVAGTVTGTQGGGYYGMLSASQVPVPAAALLLGAGLLGIVGIRRRQSV